MTDYQKTLKSTSVIDEAGLSAIIKWYKFYGFSLENYNSQDESQKKIARKHYYSRCKVMVFTAITLMFTFIIFGTEIHHLALGTVEPTRLSLIVATGSSIAFNAFNYFYTFATVINTSSFLHHLATTIVSVDTAHPSSDKKLKNIMKNRCFRMTVVAVSIIIGNVLGGIIAVGFNKEMFLDEFGYNNFSMIALAITCIITSLVHVFIYSLSIFINVLISTLCSIMCQIIKAQEIDGDTEYTQQRQDVANQQLQHAKLCKLVKHADECYAQLLLSSLGFEVGVCMVNMDSKTLFNKTGLSLFIKMYKIFGFHFDIYPDLRANTVFNKSPAKSHNKLTAACYYGMTVLAILNQAYTLWEFYLSLAPETVMYSPSMITDLVKRISLFVMYHLMYTKSDKWANFLHRLATNIDQIQPENKRLKTLEALVFRSSSKIILHSHLLAPHVVYYGIIMDMDVY
ncbi:hypothetical protein CHUAL_003563 [Chamberlinius hualienensis]